MKRKRELEEINRQVTMKKIEEIKKTAVGVKALADLKPEVKVHLYKSISII